MRAREDGSSREESPLFGIGSLFGLGQHEKSLGDNIRDVKRVTVEYAKQETIDPLKQIGRYLAFGVSGALLMAMGSVILALAALRALQNETGERFTDHLTWIPYAITIVGCAMVVALAFSAISRGKRRKAARQEAKDLQVGAQR